VSLDGIGSVHDYVRWPIRWQEFEKNLLAYQEMNLFELNTWTTVSALNIGDLKNILAYTKKHNIKHSYALLEHPQVLSVRYKNYFTTAADTPEELKSTVAQGINNWDELHLFIQKQDQLRNIKFQDFYQGIPK
jgi:sulfatase maturation enzyme AslB (radical SAM superfamily)